MRAPRLPELVIAEHALDPAKVLAVVERKGAVRLRGPDAEDIHGGGGAQGITL